MCCISQSPCVNTWHLYSPTRVIRFATCLPLLASPPRLQATVGCVKKPQGVVKVRNALQTSCYLLKTTPPCVYCIQLALLNFSLETQSRQLCVRLPLPQQLQWPFGHPLSTVSLWLQRLLSKVNFGKKASRQFHVLIKSSLNMQNIRDTFYKEVNSGRSHYPLLISLIKSTPATKEETQIKEKKLSLRKEF